MTHLLATSAVQGAAAEDAADGSSPPRDTESSSVAARPPVERLDPALADAELVRRARDGDRWAEEALYRRHAPGLGNLAARILGDRDAALDVVQDAFVIALDELDRLREPSRVKAWLRRVVVHQVHRRLRRARLRRMVGLVRPAAASNALPELAAPGAPAGERRAELALIDRALSQVSPQARLCWSLRVIESYAMAEVAQACGISESTAKRRIREAEAAIARHLAPREGAR